MRRRCTLWRLAVGTRRAEAASRAEQLRGWVRAITAHGVRGDPVCADSVPAELYREDKAGGSVAGTSGLQKAGWKTVCRRERASEELTLPLRPAVEQGLRPLRPTFMLGRRNKWCEGFLEETGTRKVEFSVWRNREPVQHTAPRLHPALSGPSGKGRKLRVRGPGPGRRLSE